ncbi:MAG: NTP transferase domain-containing protein [Verrucomicrobia bacterium]|nr:NTP transferase domain-containing protein [Verrucomicrobiota bacterium]MCF7709355.1 NTP transferase domain-containing protein [Verrucomicrobiota bacterium]
MEKERFIIIMAGGRGERFWPVSRGKTPKQLINILGTGSFLQQAFERAVDIVPKNNIIVVTNKDQHGSATAQLPSLPQENVVAEPCGRDTCAAVALGAAVVGARNKDSVMAVLPADHIISPAAEFERVISDSLKAAGAHPLIATIGIKPTEPATGYGYIHVGEELDALFAPDTVTTKFHKALQFVEKPAYATALEYLESGDFRWNSGMFVWSLDTLLDGFSKHLPEMKDACERWIETAKSGKLDDILESDYPELTKTSIDFALMEHAENVIAADATFDWDDLGSWTALTRHLPIDEHGNCVAGDLIQLDSSGNIIFSANSKQPRLVALMGIKDSIVVQTEDAVLVASKEKAQDIKKLVARLADSADYKQYV